MEEALWVPTEDCEAAVKRFQELYSSMADGNSGRRKTTVAKETSRHWFATNLQRRCKALCSEYGVRVKDVYAKWQCHLLISAGPMAEPVLEAPVGADAYLQRELNEDIGEAKASAFLLQLYDCARGAQSDFRQQARGQRGQARTVQATANGRGHSMDVTCGKVVLKINEPHLKKLEGLHSAARRTAADKEEESEEEAARTFLQRVFCLLLRYEALAGGGYQAALNWKSFEVLRQEWHVQMECFASPLNSHFQHYCSAFSDTDVWFGSCGSFFEFSPSQGSYEANPPFVPSLVHAMTRHMATLLDQAEANDMPLSFIVVIPTWEHTEGWKALNEGQHLRYHLKIPQREHSYCEGAQHKRWKQQHRISSCDTSVFWWQTTAAAQKWPVTLAGVQQLKDAFACTLSESQMARYRQAKKWTRLEPVPELPTLGKRKRLGEADEGREKKKARKNGSQKENREMKKKHKDKKRKADREDKKETKRKRQKTGDKEMEQKKNKKEKREKKVKGDRKKKKKAQ